MPANTTATDDTALRTAVALAIVRAKRENNSAAEALACKLQRLKGSMAILVKVLMKKLGQQGSKDPTLSVLESLLTALSTTDEAVVHPPEQPSGSAPSASASLTQQQTGSKRARTSGQSEEESTPVCNTQTQQATPAFPSPHPSSVAQACSDAAACSAFSLPAADAAQIQQRTVTAPRTLPTLAESLTRLVEASHAVQLAAAALMPCEAPGASPLDTFCSEVPHQTVLAFVQDTLVCLPPSTLRQAYMHQTARLLASFLSNTAAPDEQKAVSMAADVTAVLSRLLDVAHAQAGTQEPPSLQARPEAASAFLTSALDEPQLGQLLLLCCSQTLDHIALFCAALPSRLLVLQSRGDSTAADLLQQTATKHTHAKDVISWLDACVNHLPGWVACCSSGGAAVEGRSNGTGVARDSNAAAVVITAAQPHPHSKISPPIHRQQSQQQQHDLTQPPAQPQRQQQRAIPAAQSRHTLATTPSQQEPPQPSDQHSQDALTSVLGLAVHHLACAYRCLLEQSARTPLLTTTLMRSLVALAASLQLAARTPPINQQHLHATAPPAESCGVSCCPPDRRAACLELCMKLRKVFEPGFAA